MDEKKMQEIMSDEAFVKELLELDTPEEVQAKLKERGVDMSVEEITRFAKAQSEGELDEDALENVAGGSKWWDPFRLGGDSPSGRKRW